MRAQNRKKSQHEGDAAALLQILHFVHDKGIAAIGATMRGRLSKTQASILWLIRSEGERARCMLRKDIARRLHNLLRPRKPGNNEVFANAGRASAPTGALDGKRRFRKVILTPKR